MKPCIYLVGMATIFDGVLHLLFPERWNALWMAQTHRLVPGVAQQLEGFYGHYPTAKRLQGLCWGVLGLCILCRAGSAE